MLFHEWMKAMEGSYMLEKIHNDMKEAMKAKDTIALGTLRMLLAAIKNEEINKRGKLEESEIIALVKRGIKTRKESIDLYEKGNRKDLVDKEKKEVEILENYLPKQLSEEQIANLVDETIAAIGATGKKDSGKVIREVISKHKDEVDGATVSRLVSSRLEPPPESPSEPSD